MTRAQPKEHNNKRSSGSLAKATQAHYPDFDPVERQRQIVESIELHANGWTWRAIAAHQNRDLAGCYRDWQKAIRDAVPDELAAEVIKVQMDRFDAIIRTWLPLATTIKQFVRRDGKLVPASENDDPADIIVTADKDAAMVVLRTEELRAKMMGTMAATRFEVQRAPTAADLEAKLAAYLQGVKDSDAANRTA